VQKGRRKKKYNALLEETKGGDAAGGCATGKKWGEASEGRGATKNKSKYKALTEHKKGKS